jgi:L-fuculokinase
MDKVIAVLDIGKTNKKVALYNEKMELVQLKSESFPSIAYEDVRIEQVEEIESWFLSILKEAVRQYQITCISITTHGAAAVCIDGDEKISVPPLDYTTEVDASIHDAFFAQLGSRELLQKKTCTAEIKPIINVGKMLFFASQRFPEAFSETRQILLYPQYFSWRLTGEIWADYTYAGCHTYLWDFVNNSWSFVADKLGIGNMLPEKVNYPGALAGYIRKEISEKTGLSPDTPVLVGVHDSNSSLIPYLLLGEEDFLLNSTGTWCVAMHPEAEALMQDEDIGNTVFFNLSVMNSPVKTAIFMGGLEFESWSTLIQQLHNRDDYPDFNQSLANEIITQAEYVILPGVVQGAGQFPDAKAGIVCKHEFTSLEDIQKGERIPEILYDYEKAYTILLLSLALHTQVAFERAGLKPGSPVYTEGGFRYNGGYNKLIAALFPENPFFTTGIDEATSFGAALLGWSHIQKKPLQDLASLSNFEKIAVKAAELEDISHYQKRFFSLMN